MKIIAAPDSFKGSLTAKAAACAIEEGIKRHNASIEIIKIPLADGGEGTAQTLCDATGGTMVSAVVRDPLMREITAQYALLGGGKTAVIEMAEASGLPLLKASERNPLITTTYGTGQLVRAALDRGCRRFIMAIGGSATNDGGMGMMAALGAVFYDRDGRALMQGGGALPALAGIDIAGLDARLAEAEFVAACDVNNPLCGENGAAAVFGPQKGASLADVKLLDGGLANYGQHLQKLFGREFAQCPGAGAAGGLGAGLAAFLNSRMEPGAALVKKEVRFAQRLAGADLLITGEGRMDMQTLSGKTPFAAACEAKALGVPAIAVCGGLGDLDEAFYTYFQSVCSIVSRPMALEEATENAYGLLADAVFRMMRVFDR